MNIFEEARMPVLSFRSLPVIPFLIAFILFCSSTIGAQADDWPQWLGPKRDGVWRETGIVTKLPNDLPVAWRAPVGEGYAGPAVADGRVFVTDWVRDANARPPKSAFERARLQGKESVHCLDEKTGKNLWTHSYDCPYGISYAAGPRCTPLVARSEERRVGKECRL